MKKKMIPEILPPITAQTLPPTPQKIFEGSYKKVRIPTKFSPELASEIRKSRFRGLWIFANHGAFVNWMSIHSEKLVKEYRGTYNAAIKRWYFPWGATLDLQIMEKNEDFNKLRGMNFSYVEITGSIDKEIQEKALEIIASGFRR